MKKSIKMTMSFIMTLTTTIAFVGCSKSEDKVANISLNKENHNIVKLVNDSKKEAIGTYKVKKVETENKDKTNQKENEVNKEKEEEKKEPIQKKDPNKISESQAQAVETPILQNETAEVDKDSNNETNQAEEIASENAENTNESEVLEVDNKEESNEAEVSTNVNEGIEENNNKIEEVAQILPVQYINGVPCGQTVNLGVTRFIQETYNYCAPTVVKMILENSGIILSQTQLATEMGTYGDFGTYNSDAIAILNKYIGGGYKMERVLGTDIFNLNNFKAKFKSSIDNGNPLYLCIDFDTLYGGDYGDHALCGDGYVLTPDGKDIAFISYIDPSYGRVGGRHLVTPEEMLRAIANAQEPNFVWR